MNPIAAARVRLPLFWAAVFARSLGANAVGASTFLTLIYGAYFRRPLDLVFLFIALAAAPAFVLAPLAGALAGSPRRQLVLVGCSAIGLVVIALCAAGFGPWLSCVGILAIEGACFRTGRQTLVPIAARQARVSLPRLQGAIAAAVAGGTLAGIALGIPAESVAANDTLPTPVLAALAAYAVATLALLFVRFQGEGDAPIGAGLMRPFVEALGEIVQTPHARNPFAALVLWFGLLILFLHRYGWLVLGAAERESFGVALLVGVILGGLHFHPFRTIGQVPFAMLGLLGCAIYNAVSGNWSSPVWAAGILLGVMAPPLLTGFQAALSPRHWGHGSAILYMTFALVAIVFAGLLRAFQSDVAALVDMMNGLRFGLTLLLTVFAWVVFFRPAIEIVVEIVFLPVYRFKAVGPGFAEMPWKGPCLVIANHGAMLDPLWIAKYMPLPPTPLMTSKFYDLPVISWLMRRVVGTIRVPDVVLRREAPELQQAIAALDRGDCVVIFPEGWLRRKDEVPLRRFGRGVWQILKARPNTPVFAFWIEGNWGSFFSWRGGKLMAGKPMDFWRKIEIAGIGRRLVSPEALQSHLATRAALMSWVLESRALLGLPPIASVSIPEAGDEEGPARPGGKGDGRGES